MHVDFVDHLDFTSLNRIDKSFIDENMKNKESYLIYTIMYKNKPVYIYLLMEFQSTVDLSMPLRFLRYILELSESYGKNMQSGLYPAVFPLLIYNGEQKWSAKKNPKELFETTINEKFIPDFEYYPIIINEIEKNTLRKIHNAVSAMFYIENNKSVEFTEAVDDLVMILNESNNKELKLFKTWLNSLLKDYEIQVSQEIMDKLIIPMEVVTMFAANNEKSRAEALEQGIKKERKEIALKLLEAGTKFEFISKITGFTLKELKKLSEES